MWVWIGWGCVPVWIGFTRCMKTALHYCNMGREQVADDNDCWQTLAKETGCSLGCGSEYQTVGTELIVFIRLR